MLTLTLLLCLLNTVTAQTTQHYFDPCRVAAPGTCWSENFKGLEGLPSAKFTLVNQAGSTVFENGGAAPVYTVDKAAGFTTNTATGALGQNGALRGDLNRGSSPMATCGAIRGSMVLLKDITTAVPTIAAPVGPRPDYRMRFKFRFGDDSDTCVGFVFAYKAPSDYFLVKVCRRYTSTQACLSVQQYKPDGSVVNILAPTGIPGIPPVGTSFNVWYELEWVNLMSISYNSLFAGPAQTVLKPVSSLPIDLSGALDDFNDAEHSGFGIFTAGSNVQIDDVVVHTEKAVIESVAKECRQPDAPASKEGESWCRYCFFNCPTERYPTGIQAACANNDGFCREGTPSRCLDKFGGQYCVNRPTPAPTPRPTPAPTVAPTPAPLPRPETAPSCAAAGRFLHPNSNAGQVCNACNEFQLASGEHCVWCEGNGVSYCQAASEACAGTKVTDGESCGQACEAPPNLAGLGNLCALTANLLDTGVPKGGLCAIANTPTSDACYNAAGAHSPACFAAVAQYDCTRDCQPCTPPDQVSRTNPFLKAVCQPVCDAIIANCGPTARSLCLSARQCATGTDLRDFAPIVASTSPANPAVTCAGAITTPQPTPPPSLAPSPAPTPVGATPPPSPAPTPAPATLAPTPMPTPDPNAACSEFTVCSQCLDVSIKTCHWCNGAGVSGLCVAGASSACAHDAAAKLITESAECPTRAPTPAPTPAPTLASTPLPSPAPSPAPTTTTTTTQASSTTGTSGPAGTNGTAAMETTEAATTSGSPVTAPATTPVTSGETITGITTVDVDVATTCFLAGTVAVVAVLTAAQ